MYSSSPLSSNGEFQIVVLIPAIRTERIGFPDAAPFMQMATDAGNVPVVQFGWAFVAANHGYLRTRSSGPILAM